MGSEGGQAAQHDSDCTCLVAQKLLADSETRLHQHISVTPECHFTSAHQPPKGGEGGAQSRSHVFVLARLGAEASRFGISSLPPRA